MSEEQVEQATGSKWVARASQTPEGQEMMREIFGPDSDDSDADSSHHDSDSDAGGREPDQ